MIRSTQIPRKILQGVETHVEDYMGTGHNKNIAYIANKTIAKNNQQGVVVIKGKELVSLPRPNLLNYPGYIITGLTITNKNTGKDFIIEFKKEISSNQYKNGTMVCKDIK